MARKKKIEIKDEELIPTTIGVIDKRQAGLFYLVFVFIILIGFVYFMPEAIEFIENYNQDDVLYEEVEEDLSYTSGMSITGEDVTLSNIVLNGYTLTFDIKNTSNSSVNLENDNMYLEIYDEYENLIGRLNFSDINILSGETYAYSSVLLYNDVDYFIFDRILETDYPEVTLNTDDNGVENLVCVKDDTIITYEFSDNYLEFMTEKIYVDEVDVVNYINLVTEYSSYSGVSASLETDIENYFSYNIDLSVYDGDIENDYIYSYYKSAKIISFEMISEGFDCN